MSVAATAQHVGDCGENNSRCFWTWLGGLSTSVFGGPDDSMGVIMCLALACLQLDVPQASPALVSVFFRLHIAPAPFAVPQRGVSEQPSDRTSSAFSTASGVHTGFIEYRLHL